MSRYALELILGGNMRATTFSFRQPSLPFVALLLAACLPAVNQLRALDFPPPGAQSIRMVILGDSIMWGQGLLEKDKHHALVADMLRSCHDGLSVSRIVFAHSAAHIGMNE